MNIEQVKTEWEQYNQKLELSQQLTDKIIVSMLKERSRSRVSKIRRNNKMYMALMTLNLAVLAAIFVGNPFDFKYKAQYIPYGLLTLGVILAILTLFESLKSLDVNMNKVNLDTFLKRTIKGYEKSKKMEKYFSTMILSAGLLTAFSFLPKKLENKELWAALGETAISVAITLLIYFFAFKFGAFKNSKQEEFENDLKELNELKTISSELRDN